MRLVSVLALLAVSACGSAPPGAARWRGEIQTALESGDARGAVSTYAAWKGELGDDDPVALRRMAVLTLWQGIRVPSPAIQLEAIQGIERQEIEPLAQDVVDRVSSDSDVVAAAAAAAVLRAHPYAPRVLGDLLRSDDPRARAIAVDGIGRKVGARAREDLLPLLEDGDAGVRAAAARAVGGFGDDQDTAALIAVATGDDDAEVRAAALEGLATGDRASLDDAVDAGLADADGRVRAAAAALIADEDRLRSLSAGDDPWAAVAAAIALGRAGGAPDPAILERARAADDWRVRAMAMRDLADLAGGQAALYAGGRGLYDAHPQVRIAAARSLIALGQPERAALALSRLMDGASPELRADAARAHAGGVPSPALVAALADDSPIVRIAAAEALYTLGR